MEKAPDAFRTISEVAEEIDVPQHVLRFWESRFAQIRPLKRGGGRRYYRPNDVDLLRGVRHLLYGEGYTIRGVQRLLREQGQSFVQSVWRAGTETPSLELDDNGASDIEDQADAGSDDDLSVLQIAPRLAGEPRPHERREPKLVPPNSNEPVPQRIAAEQRRKLQTALDDLIACRRVLDAALSETPAAQD
ncbi:MAG TPA: MerR family transcriptional regulator [Candidatus Acidoferrum sp.]|nr:MerR family transcriptional regulator [Candidatus Acidoferrum sp.]